MSESDGMFRYMLCAVKSTHSEIFHEFCPEVVSREHGTSFSITYEGPSGMWLVRRFSHLGKLSPSQQIIMVNTLPSTSTKSHIQGIAPYPILLYNSKPLHF